MLATSFLLAATLGQNWIGDKTERERPRPLPASTAARQTKGQAGSPAPLVINCFLDASDSDLPSEKIRLAVETARSIWLKAGIDWRFTEDKKYACKAVVRLYSDLSHYGMTIGNESVVRDGGYDGSGESTGLIIAHELGHVLGLHHVTQSGNLMGPYDGLDEARISPMQAAAAKLTELKRADFATGPVTKALREAASPLHLILVYAYNDAPSMKVRGNLARSPLLQIVDVTHYHEFPDSDYRAHQYIEVVKRARSNYSPEKYAPAILLLDTQGRVLECIEGAELTAPEPLAQKLLPKAKRP